jgi:hypothetical protein
MNRAGIFLTLEVRKAVSQVNYYFWQQYVESTQEAVFCCFPELYSIVLQLKTLRCL